MSSDNDSTKDNVREALAADVEQTKSDMPGMEGRDLDQDVDDTVRQAMGKEEAPRAD